MKIPTTFGWLSAAVLTATMVVLTATKMLGLAAPSPSGPAVLPYVGPAAAPTVTAESTAAPRIQIAFLLDTSSSMDGLIDQAKARLWNILNEIQKAEKDGQTPRIEVALYHYGNTTLLPEHGYIEQLLPLSDDVDAFSERLFGLSTSGGDEYCGHAVLRATDELGWDEDAATVKIIYVAGNESFAQGEVAPADALAKAAGRNITVNTILCGDPNGPDGPSWRAGARNGKGEFFYINQDEKVVFIPSPFDLEIEKCNLQLNETYVPFGSSGASLKANQLRQDANADAYGKANLSSRACFKASKSYKNTKWDLVDAYAENQQRVIKEQSSLPDSLATLAPDQLRAAIVSLGEQRNALQQRIQELVQKRDAFVAGARAEAASDQQATLGERITGSVRKKLQAEGYVVKK